MRQAGEPSVEDILASIKQVIARDIPPAHGPGDTANGHDSALRERFGDVLDLGDIGAQVLSAQVPGSEPPLADVDAPLLNAATAAAMRDSLGALAARVQTGGKAQGLRPGETSLEALTRDLLKPMLAQWLDAHLPAIVERLVAAEIARATR